MVLKANDLNLFFIHYATGTFGSSLYHALMSSQEFVRYYEINIDVFNEDSAAHKNIFYMFNNFHKDPEIQLWKTLDQEEKISFLNSNLNLKVSQSNLFQPPVLVSCYDALIDIKNIFPTAKNVIILFEKNKTDLLAKIKMNKLHKKNLYFFKINGKVYNLNEKKLNYRLKLEYEKSIFNYFYNQQQNVILNKDDFIFNFEDFFTYNSFKSRFISLCEHFNLTLNNEFIESFYNKFYENNKEYLI